MQINIKTFISAVAVGIILAVIAFFIPVVTSGSRNVGAIESIQGIPYPRTEQGIHITQSLAHADIYLDEPVVGKTLELTITYTPDQADTLLVGVRENDFWLSYPWQVLHSEDNANQTTTTTVNIPLTDKLQESNRSIDLMFFAGTTPNEANIDQGINDRTSWYIQDIQAQVIATAPTLPQLKDYLRSIITKERPA